MKTILSSFIGLLLLLLPLSGIAQDTPKSTGIIVERTFWVKPGKERQFATLFDRTQLPRLKALLGEHQIASFSTASPLLHTSNEQWAFRVKIKWSSWEAFAKDASSHADQKVGSTQSYEQALFGDLVADRKDTVIQEDLYGTSN
ncbi:hypothetical protein [Solilutibacter silvestris]|uniref:Antibiotic biosynthesis monooxygenase n=1 Tax=Solilutibacter silvestris TaxID=1645665 RepID=A0A2K1Q414_9GAMM|nr:hypothetical protein [Lysobacter silvestris]PNS09741.1 hypothetical protein Lysil_1370 [Lysobacter silvestris]